MKKKIHTLAQLKEEKRKLQIQKAASKQLFFDSMGHARKTAAHFLLTKVLLPAGATGVAAWGVNKLFSSENGKGQAHPVTGQPSGQGGPTYKLLQQMLPLGVKLLMAYLGKKAVDEAVE